MLGRKLKRLGLLISLQTKKSLVILSKEYGRLELKG